MKVSVSLFQFFFFFFLKVYEQIQIIPKAGGEEIVAEWKPPSPRPPTQSPLPIWTKCKTVGQSKKKNNKKKRGCGIIALPPLKKVRPLFIHSFIHSCLRVAGDNWLHYMHGPKVGPLNTGFAPREWKFLGLHSYMRDTSQECQIDQNPELSMTLQNCFS